MPTTRDNMPLVTCKLVLDKKTGKMKDVTPSKVKKLAKRIRKTRASPPKSRYIKNSRSKAVWPLVSFNAGVSEDQVDSVNEELRKHGVHDAYHNKDGDAVWASTAAKRRWMKVMGCMDRSAYY